MVKKSLRKVESRSESLTGSCNTHFIKNTSEGAANHKFVAYSQKRLNFYSITKEKITFQKSLKLNFPIDLEGVPEYTFLGKNRIIFRVEVSSLLSTKKTKKFIEENNVDETRTELILFEFKHKESTNLETSFTPKYLGQIRDRLGWTEFGMQHWVENSTPSFSQRPIVIFYLGDKKRIDCDPYFAKFDENGVNLLTRFFKINFIFPDLDDREYREEVSKGKDKDFLTYKDKDVSYEYGYGQLRTSKTERHQVILCSTAYHLKITAIELKTRKLLNHRSVSIFEILDESEHLTEIMNQIKKRLGEQVGVSEGGEGDKKVNIWLKKISHPVYSQKMDVLQFVVCFSLEYKSEELYDNLMLLVRVIDLMSPTRRTIVLNPINSGLKAPNSEIIHPFSNDSFSSIIYKEGKIIGIQIDPLHLQIEVLSRVDTENSKIETTVTKNPVLEVETTHLEGREDIRSQKIKIDLENLSKVHRINLMYPIVYVDLIDDQTILITSYMRITIVSISEAMVISSTYYSQRMPSEEMFYEVENDLMFSQSYYYKKKVYG